MSLEFEKGMSASELLDENEHNNSHVKELLKLYPDLAIIKSKYSVDFYSELINSECSLFTISSLIHNYDSSIHTLDIYKNVDIKCDYCNGLVKVNARPSNIPFLFESNINNNITFYEMIYENVLNHYNFNTSNFISTIRLFILNKLNDQNKKQKNINLSFLSSEVRKLLPFI